MAKKPKSATESAKVPSVLAFNRKIEPSDALMQAGLWGNRDKVSEWKNIDLHEKRNRGTKSQYGVPDEEKTDPNLVWGDDARLPFATDTLKVFFTVKFLGNIAEPTTHNRPEFEQKLKVKFAEYSQEIGFLSLAQRYVYNLVNGRFLWRNRLGAEKISVHIKNTETGQVWNFEDAYQYGLNAFDTVQDSQITEIANLVAKSFQKDHYLLLEVTAFAKVGEGQHIFPSQEMVMDIPKGQKSKYLYQIKTQQGLCAGIHSEKIGNAIRTIDTWYIGAEDQQDSKPAIAVEPYGSVPNRGIAYRTSQTDFYTLLINWLEDKEIPEEDQHFIIANLIRGGVFGGND
ncbi:type I-F CRISPR-associated protein Csy3 [Acinetobacter baumannii]|uniref:type I-F CRISPR-associated protein Csy3 n=1 Tax=Acinetobacter baumannii TaxID=470 RepID=UPI002AFB4A0F|nr:type I-F CRISPR-associated protein Csy3 [Acinetobacter baumannii]